MRYYKNHLFNRCMVLTGTIILVLLCAVSLGADTMAAEANLGEMYSRAVDFPEGDLTRLASVLRKAQRGEEITVGFIGGSITEGYAASMEDNCYVSLVYQWLCEKFPQTPINLINAGIGGTSSYLGVHRVEEEVLSKAPDLVFVEFAVNDTFTEFCMNSYENLIRKILGAESNPALVLLFSVNAVGDSVQAVEAALGEYYKVPMISYGNAVFPEIVAGNFQWLDIASDVVHPNDMGHSIYAALITGYLDAVCARLDEIPEGSDWEMPEAVTPQIYTDAHIENAATLLLAAFSGFGVEDYNYYYKNNWYAAADNAYITFHVEASDIGIIYQRTIDATFGIYDVYIDGEFAGTLNGNYIEGSGTQTDTAQLFSSPTGEKAMHTVTIEKNPLSVNTAFIIVGLLVS